MGIRRTDKAALAAKHASGATASFEDAQQRLETAIDLLTEHEVEQREVARQATVVANAAAADKARHVRVHGRISDLLA